MDLKNRNTMLGQIVLREGDVDIWLAKISDFSEELLLSKFLPLLNSYEKQRMSKFVYSDSRKIFLLAHALQRVALSKYLNLEADKLVFLNEENGRPELESHNNLSALRFNLSHTNGLCALVVTSRNNIGIDVEEHKKILDLSNMLDSSMSSIEQEEIDIFRAIEKRSEEFLIRWTLKEAYSKAVGQGLLLPFNQITFKFHNSDFPMVIFGPDIKDNEVEWYFYYLRLENHHLSAALHSNKILGKKLKPRLFDFKKLVQLY